MKKFKNMNINRKIKWSFILILTSVIIMGLWGIVTSYTINKRYKVDVSNSLKNLGTSYDLLKDVLELEALNNSLYINANDKELFQNLSQEVEEIFVEFDTNINSYISFLQNENNPILLEQVENLENIKALFEEYKNHYKTLPTYILQDNIFQLRLLLSQNLTPKINTIVDLIETDNAFIEKFFGQTSGKTEIFANSVIIGNTLIMAISLIFANFLRIFLSKHISGNITNLLYITDDFVEGKINTDIKIESHDEIGLLEANIQKVIKIVSDLSEDISKASNSINNDGELDYRIDEFKYNGVYKEMATKINQLSEGFTQDYVYFIDRIDELGNGVFDKELKQFPGKKRMFSDGLENIQNKFVKINIEIENIINNVENGNLDFEIEDTDFNGQWKNLINGLNDVVHNMAEPIEFTINAVEKIARGDLDFQIQGEYKGEFLRLKNSLNSTSTELSTYINDISFVLNEIGNQNLDVEVSVEYKGNFVDIKNSLNRIISNLNNIISEINISADQVALGAKDIAHSSIQLADSSTEQAHIVEQLLTSVNLISSETVNNVEYAESAREMAGLAHEKATIGSVEMTQMLDSMEEINIASNNIQTIIKVIDDIAFQTNLLALNAAVEAARAGNHGKGFAVVAEEVRNLAARSKNAARETSDLINGSIEKVIEGREIANTTSITLDGIVAHVKEITELVTQVADGSNQQSTSINEINKAINKISEVAQINTATSQEEAAASEQLSSQSQVFKNMVSGFIIKKENSKPKTKKPALKDKAPKEKLVNDNNYDKKGDEQPSSSTKSSNENIFKELSELTKMDSYNNTIANGNYDIDFENKDLGKY